MGLAVSELFGARLREFALPMAHNTGDSSFDVLRQHFFARARTAVSLMADLL